MCHTAALAGGSVSLTTFTEKEHGESITEILSWFFGAGKARKEPVLSLAVNEDEAFQDN